MAKTSFKLQITRNYESQEAAIKAAKKLRGQNQEVVVYEEVATDSGQCFGRVIVWKDGERWGGK